MPKKRQDKHLLIKPGSNSSHTFPSTSKHGSNTPSVNDLIRDSRRLQLRDEHATSSPVNSSVPPNLRDLLNLPPPQAPKPREGNGPSRPLRLRRTPGPPPPRSWLADSDHAPSTVRDSEYQGFRIQTGSSRLPGSSLAMKGSLLHFTLKELAVNWNWHVEFDGTYLATLPVTIKQSLLSYIAAYSDDVHANPLRLLFLGDEERESAQDVQRLDLAGAIGTWTTLKQLTSDLVNAPDLRSVADIISPGVPTSWDDDESSGFTIPILNHFGMMFKNLKHLSLAINPGTSVSWKDLIRLASEVSTITSLSLAYWPQPTYTPRAAATRVVIKTTGGQPGAVYGGSNIYTALDDDWREAAGILGTLSRTLYCLKWLDLTGCGEWFGALKWQSDDANLGPEWNGSWRGVEYVGLAVGWTPVPPKIKSNQSGDRGWDVTEERQKYYYQKELRKEAGIARTADEVAVYLRQLRRKGGGKWIEFGTGLPGGSVNMLS
jgi:hypothetical protein